ITCVGLRICYVFFFQAEDGIRDSSVTGVQTCALPICGWPPAPTTTPAGHPGCRCSRWRWRPATRLPRRDRRAGGRRDVRRGQLRGREGGGEGREGGSGGGGRRRGRRTSEQRRSRLRRR